MSTEQFIVDLDRCKHDGLCALECPLGLIELDDAGNPVPVADFDQNCVFCGHCLSVCPAACLTVRGADSASLPEAPRDPVAGNGLNPSGIHAWMAARRARRLWKDAPVDRAVIERCLETARYAPSGINMQPVHWLVLHDTAKVRELTRLVAEALRVDPEFGVKFASYLVAYDAGHDVILRSAPHVLIAHADASGWYDPATDAVIALSHFELAAHGEGVGTCWAGVLRRAAETSPAVREFLALPEGHNVYGALMLGWPKGFLRRLPPRKPVDVAWR